MPKRGAAAGRRAWWRRHALCSAVCSVPLRPAEAKHTTAHPTPLRCKPCIAAARGRLAVRQQTVGADLPLEMPWGGGTHARAPHTASRPHCHCGARQQQASDAATADAGLQRALPELPAAPLTMQVACWQCPLPHTRATAHTHSVQHTTTYTHPPQAYAHSKHALLFVASTQRARHALPDSDHPGGGALCFFAARGPQRPARCGQTHWHHPAVPSPPRPLLNSPRHAQRPLAHPPHHTHSHTHADTQCALRLTHPQAHSHSHTHTHPVWCCVTAHTVRTTRAHAASLPAQLTAPCRRRGWRAAGTRPATRPPRPWAR